MFSFYESSACMGRAHCKSCRSTSAIGLAWRKNIAKKWAVDGGDEFVCPHGLSWGAESPVIVTPPVATKEVVRDVVKDVVQTPVVEPVEQSRVRRRAHDEEKKVDRAVDAVHPNSGMVGYRDKPCSNLGVQMGNEERRCCGGKVRIVDVFRCAAGVNNGKVSKDTCISCGFYRVEEAG